MSSFNKAVIIDGELPIGFVQHKMTYADYCRQAADWFCDLTHGAFPVDHEVMDDWHIDADGNIEKDFCSKEEHSEFYRKDAYCVLMPVSKIPANFDPDELCYEDLGQVEPEEFPDREAYKAEVQKVLREHPDDLVMVIDHHY